MWAALLAQTLGITALPNDDKISGCRPGIILDHGVFAGGGLVTIPRDSTIYDICFSQALQRNEATTFPSLHQARFMPWTRFSTTKIPRSFDLAVQFSFSGWNILGFVNYSRHQGQSLWRLFTNHIDTIRCVLRHGLW